MLTRKLIALGVGFVVGFMAVSIFGCGEAPLEPYSGLTKEEAAAYAKADGWFECPDEWFGDGWCDWYCTQPDPDCAPPRPDDHRPYCNMNGSQGAGWYWGDTDGLIKLEACLGMREPECCGISSRSEGWCTDSGLITWDAECHQTVRISLWGEACGASIGFTCYEPHNLYCQGVPSGVVGGTGTCRDMGYCEEVGDCEDPDNLWGHAKCIGYPSCEETRCVWHCDDSQPQGPWSWTTILLAQVESEHPYGENLERQWVVRRQGAARIKIHFQDIDVESGYDWITVATDGAESALVLDGVHHDTWTPEFEGDNLYITLVTDYSINRWGFRADMVSYYEQLPAGMCNRDEDCPQGQGCNPHNCFNPYEACYGDCRPDENPSQTFTSIQKVDIPDNDPAGITSTVEVSGLSDCDLGVTYDLSIGHTYVGDLVVGLTSPAGQRVVLLDREGGNQDNVVVEDVEVSGWGSLHLGDVTGVWTLDVSDHAAIDIGTLETWALTFSCR